MRELLLAGDHVASLQLADKVDDANDVAEALPSCVAETVVLSDRVRRSVSVSENDGLDVAVGVADAADVAEPVAERRVNVLLALSDLLPLLLARSEGEREFPLSVRDRLLVFDRLPDDDSAELNDCDLDLSEVAENDGVRVAVPLPVMLRLAT